MDDVRDNEYDVLADEASRIMIETPEHLRVARTRAEQLASLQIIVMCKLGADLRRVAEALEMRNGR